MSREHVDHPDVAAFARDRVNLPKANGDEYRAQARQLREKLERYLAEHEDFALKRMRLSGSLAKGTALRSLNDIDVACYVTGANAPDDTARLLEFLADKLRTAFPNFKPGQVQPQTYSVTVSFRGTGLDVDVVPILYTGDPDWYGELVSQDDGSRLETCIPRHLDFIRKRKDAHPEHFAQIARLLKSWAKKVKSEDASFRCKSFIIELILAHVSDNGATFSDYPEALQQFFTYVASSRLRDQICFTDYHSKSAVGAFEDLIQIIDPANPNNNVASLYTQAHADALVEAALDAGDAIEAALRAQTKSETIRYWQKVFGSSFQP